jgi:hypothetical protein
MDNLQDKEGRQSLTYIFWNFLPNKKKTEKTIELDIWFLV